MCPRPLLGEDWATNTEADLSPYTDLGQEDTDSFDSFCNLPPESQLLPGPVKMEVTDSLVEEPTSILLDPPCSSSQSSMYRCVNPMEDISGRALYACIESLLCVTSDGVGHCTITRYFKT